MENKECTTKYAHFYLVSQSRSKIHAIKGPVCKVIAYLYNSDEVMKLLLTINAIRQQDKNVRIWLCIPYFPYARQDRVCREGEAFSLEVMADLINNLKCDKVTVYDPHSLVTKELVNNIEVVEAYNLFHQSVVSDLILKEKLGIIAPDKGCYERAEVIAKIYNTNVIYFKKHRCRHTGEVKGFTNPDDIPFKSYLMVDDICDGGGTFIMLARHLDELAIKDLYLYVTHGVFSNGLDCLRPYFKHVYCYHTFLTPEQIDPSFLTVIGNTR
jgi:ribose-phosphate pyrophosphokinase